MRDENEEKPLKVFFSPLIYIFPQPLLIPDIATALRLVFKDKLENKTRGSCLEIS